MELTIELNILINFIHYWNNKMATLIKKTPILMGRDATRFQERMTNIKKISPERRKEMEDNYNKIKSISKF